MAETLLAWRTVDGRGLQRSLSAYLRDQAAIAEQTSPVSPPRDRIEGTRNFALYIDAQDAEFDQRLATLSIGQRHQGNRTGIYKPGPAAARLIVSIGNLPLPPEAILAELVRAALEDALSAVMQSQNERGRQREQEIQAEAVRVADERIAQANARVDQAIAAEAVAEGRVAELARELSYFKPLLEANGGELPPEPVDDPEDDGEPFRRRKFDGDPVGVYRTRHQDGLIVFEIVWPHEGKSKWETIGPSRDAAIAAREAKLAEPAEVEPAQEPSGQTSGSVRSLEEIPAR